MGFFLLLLSNDIETQPGPSKCFQYSKTIRRNQSRVSCQICQKEYHLRCFDEITTMGVCSDCTRKNELGSQLECSSTSILPDLEDLCKEKGIKLFHQNIRGLLTKAPHIENILQENKNIHVFTLSETHINCESESLVNNVQNSHLFVKTETLEITEVLGHIFQTNYIGKGDMT